MEAKRYKTVVERYCPVVGHNVAVEVSHMSGKDNGSCLHSHNCERERGGCSNSFFNTASHRK